MLRLCSEKAELEARDAELRARIEELEKNKGVTTKLESENAELKARVAKLEEDYRQMQNEQILESKQDEEMNASLPKKRYQKFHLQL